MKRETLKKGLLIESGVIAAGLVGLCVIIWIFSAISDRLEENNRNLKTEVNTLTGTTNVLLEKYTKVKQNGPLYLEALQKKENQQLSISREVVRQRFDQFNTRYHLSGMRLVMGGIEDVPDPRFKNNTGGIIGSDVSVSADALSDLSIFNSINAMLQEMPGGVKITHIELNRATPITPQVLQTISKTGAFGVVKADLHFTWYGIRFNESPSESDTHAPPTP